MTAPKDFGPDSEPIPSMEGWMMPDYSNYPKMDIRSNIVPPGHTTMPPLAERRRSRAVAVLPSVCVSANTNDAACYASGICPRAALRRFAKFSTKLGPTKIHLPFT
jgi:hypothetical protein